MPFDKSIYPKYWRQFSEYIRFERAGNICECTGVCGVVHDALGDRCRARNGEFGKIGRDGVWRDTDSIHRFNSHEGAALYPDFDFIGSKVVLTVAHLDHAGGVCRCRRLYGFKCSRLNHVLALCQSCHLNLDRDKHVAVRLKNIARKKDEQRGLLNLT
jgi:hypothetical protein